MSDALPFADIQTLGHEPGQGIQAAAIGPLRLPVLERIALLDAPLLIEDPDRFRNVDQLVSPETSCNEVRTHRTSTLDILRSVIIGEAVLLPGCGSPTCLIASLKYRYRMPGIAQSVSGG